MGLAIASLLFYGYWKPAYLGLFLLSICANYYTGKAIEGSPLKGQRSKFFLGLGISFNLLLLAYYKYADFFLQSISNLFSLSLPSVEIILPLAISFYSFTQIAYLVDAYRGETKQYEYNLVSYSLFISFFPQLIAGPILRYDELLPQFQMIRTFALSSQNLAMGFTLFILGLFKKVAIADHLSPWVNPVFAHAQSVTFLEAWIGVLAYTFQLYFDFSGYSDMAIGLGWMFNVQLPVNFNSPYKSTSIREFWRRWHITLSNFLRDYLYIPLGGNRQGKLRQSLNLMITMLLGGLWHGAGWNFVFWGGLHGLYLAMNNLWDYFKFSCPKMVSWFMTFLGIILGWVFFRAATFQDGLALTKTLFFINPLTLPTAYQGILKPLQSWWTMNFVSWQELRYLPSIGLNNSVCILLVLLIIILYGPNTQEMMENFKPKKWIALVVSTVACFCLLSLNQVSEFLYFQF